MSWHLFEINFFFLHLLKIVYCFDIKANHSDWCKLIQICLKFDGFYINLQAIKHLKPIKFIAYWLLAQQHRNNTNHNVRVQSLELYKYHCLFAYHKIWIPILTLVCVGTSNKNCFIIRQCYKRLLDIYKAVYINQDIFIFNYVL